METLLTHPFGIEALSSQTLFDALKHPTGISPAQFKGGHLLEIGADTYSDEPYNYWRIKALHLADTQVTLEADAFSENALGVMSNSNIPRSLDATRFFSDQFIIHENGVIQVIGDKGKRHRSSVKLFPEGLFDARTDYPELVHRVKPRVVEELVICAYGLNRGEKTLTDWSMGFEEGRPILSHLVSDLAGDTWVHFHLVRDILLGDDPEPKQQDGPGFLCHLKNGHRSNTG